MSSPNSPAPRSYSFAASSLKVATGVAAACTLLIVVARLSEFAAGERGLDWTSAAAVLSWVFAGVCATAGLYGIAALVELCRTASNQLPAPRSGSQEEPIQGLPLDDTFGVPHPDEQSSGTGHAATATVSEPGAGEPPGVAELRTLRELMTDVRDILLLNDAQRAEKARRMADHDLTRARVAVHELLERGQFVAARKALEELSRRYPERGETAALSEAIEAARAKAEARDVSSYSKRVEELIAISAWERAAAVAQELADRHPDNPTAATLKDRVERERDLFLKEQRRRMYAEIQRYVSRRRWLEAFSAARTFIERFPESVDAETLRAQLPTLEVNAQIEERQQFEAQIMEFAKHGRYIEAFNLAMHVVQTYPDSPQADALRLQLPRLKELAHNPNAPPPRPRTEPSLP